MAPIDRQLNRQWIVWKTHKLRREGYSWRNVGKWFREHQATEFSYMSCKNWYNAAEAAGQIPSSEPPQTIPVQKYIPTKRERQVAKKARSTEKRQREAAQAKKEVRILKRRLEEDGEALLALLKRKKMSTDSLEDLAGKIEETRKIDLLIYEQIMVMGIKGILRDRTGKSETLTWSEMAKFLDKIQKLKETLQDNLLGMGEKGHIKIEEKGADTPLVVEFETINPPGEVVDLDAWRKEKEQKEG